MGAPSPIETAREVQTFCEARGWRFCFIGGLAVNRWGEPRFTADADLTVLTGWGGEEAFVDALLGHFQGRIPGARDAALANRVLLLESGRGGLIDVSLAALPFEERAVARSSEFDFGGTSIRTCGPEDLIVFKAFAGRAKDWLDIEGVAVRRKGGLDVRLIFEELEPLLELKEDSETGPRLRKVLEAAPL